MLNFCYLSDDNAEVLPTPKKRTKLVKKTAKRRLEKPTNDIDEEVIPETCSSLPSIQQGVILYHATIS